MKILIIDDDREDADLLHEAVMEYAPLTECLIADSAVSARNIFKEFTPSIVFLDLVMYPVNGTEILKESIQLSALRETHFIMMSGALQPQDYTRFTDMGAKFVVTKPGTYHSLLKFAEHILSPFSVNKKAKLLTDDGRAHFHQNSLEGLLKREIQFDVTLNNRNRQANIQFEISENEAKKIRSELGFNLFLLTGGYWLPEM